MKNDALILSSGVGNKVLKSGSNFGLLRGFDYRIRSFRWKMVSNITKQVTSIKSNLSPNDPTEFL